MDLSIIICVYNTDKQYLDECLRSITLSTLAPGGGVLGVNYEICMIDDGSTVDYSDLVSKYGVSYYKTENRGIFMARLEGINVAKGKYIAFVDSDDTVSFNFHRPMLECAIRDNLDIVLNDWAFHSRGSKYYCKADETIKNNLELDGEDILHAFLAQQGRQHSFFVLWNKMFRSTVLRDARDRLIGLASGEGRFNYSEDVLISFYSFKMAKKLRGIHTGYYFYRIHTSQTVNAVSAEKLREQIKCMSYTLNRMTDEVGDDRELVAYVSAWRALMSRAHYSHAAASGYTELYAFIIDSYGVDKLQKARFKDTSYYSSNRLLPSNTEEIDRAFVSLYRVEQGARVKAKIRDPYIAKGLNGLAEQGKIFSLSHKGEVQIPKPRYSLKKRILLNTLVYRLGMRLFPKGSRIRKFLKRFV